MRIDPTTRPIAVNTPGMPRSGSACSTESSAASLATNPNNGGTPAIDAAARPAMMSICGRRAPSPDNCRTSRVPVVWSIAPTIMNSVALNIAWPSVSASAASIAARVPIDVTVMMKPSCDTVPYASTSFRSFCRSAIQPAITMVTRPSGMIARCHVVVVPNVGDRRATRKTPAFTIAAECRNADTGVGAAIAPGSQKWNGAIADLVSAPRTSSTTAVAIAGACSCSYVSAPGAVSAENSQCPVVWPMRMMPTSITRPPNVVTSSACPADLRDDARSA